uniref:Bleomycin hydrolase n=1 Tax=Monodelphis domestica TaxID=13616 RepID=A0A5F8GJF1_MONDO
VASRGHTFGRCRSCSCCRRRRRRPLCRHGSGPPRPQAGLPSLPDGADSATQGARFVPRRTPFLPPASPGPSPFPLSGAPGVPKLHPAACRAQPDPAPPDPGACSCPSDPDSHWSRPRPGRCQHLLRPSSGPRTATVTRPRAAVAMNDKMCEHPAGLNPLKVATLIQQLNCDPLFSLAQNVGSTHDLLDICLRRSTVQETQHVFQHAVPQEGKPVTNQKNSG